MHPSSEVTIRVGSKEHRITSSHPSSTRFYELLGEIAELHHRKQADYGSADRVSQDPFANVRASERFGIPAWVGAILRGNDKMARLQTFIRKGRLENEALEDSLRDLAVYAIIALVLWEEETGGGGNNETH